MAQEHCLSPDSGHSSSSISRFHENSWTYYGTRVRYLLGSRLLLIFLLGTYRIFADGGSNRVYDVLGESWKLYDTYRDDVLH
jgi:hypothetical protein